MTVQKQNMIVGGVDHHQGGAQTRRISFDPGAMCFQGHQAQCLGFALRQEACATFNDRHVHGTAL